MGRLDKKVAIVVGAGGLGPGGMGAMTAKLMGKEGAKVVSADSNGEAAEKTATEIRAAGGDAVAFAMDMSKESDVKSMVDFTDKKYGGVDVLFNDAYILVPDDAAGDIVKIDLATFDRMIEVNLRGYLLTCRYVVPVMLKRGAGSIINTASGAGIQPDKVRHAYSIVKAGILMLTKCVAIGYGEHGIRCNCVVPGWTMGYGDMPKERRDWMVNSAVRVATIRRVGRPEDIGHMVVYLASDESTYVTGQYLQVNGGMLARSPISI